MRCENEVILTENYGKNVLNLDSIELDSEWFNRCRGCDTNPCLKIPRTTGAILNSIAPRLVGC